MTTPEDAVASSSEPVEEPAAETPTEEPAEEPVTETETDIGTETETEDVTETVEVVEVTPESRPFMTTDFADYTVTEGLLLILVLLIFLQACAKLVKGGFSWLW